MKDFLKTYRRKIFWWGVLLLFSLALISLFAFYQNAKKPQLAVFFFDVGQGDAIFVESYDGTQILIDGGPPNRILPLIGKRMSYFDKYIDVVVLTHPHADHVSGLIEVLEKYNIGMLIESGVDYHTAEAKTFEKLIKEKNIKTVIIGHPVDLNFYNNAVLRFIYPEESFSGKTLKNVHDSALISEIDFEGKKILLMSDAEKNVEKRLVREGKISDIDVLKTGHHGSKTSTSESFLNAVHPSYAVIEVGAKNTYGHPHPTVLDRLANHNIPYYRTDTNGRIELVSDGSRFFVDPEH